MFLRNNSGGANWMVVFLGNPGQKYASSRHNIGFMTADELQKLENIKINRARFNSLTTCCSLRNEKVLLLKPQTFMNLSGNAVGPAAAYYKIPPERIIVVCDDISLPIGKLRIRSKGSSGGHNGLKSIISALGTDCFPRIKVGVGSPDHNCGEDAVIDWVLGNFCGKEASIITEACQEAAKAVLSIIDDGIDRAMNIYN